MSHFADSRDPAGIGYLILRDTGYKAKGLTDANRGSLVAVEVQGRRDGESEDGKWVEDKNKRGPISGGVFWAREKERAGGWQFGWATVVDRLGVGGGLRDPRGGIRPETPGSPHPGGSVTDDPRTGGGLGGNGTKAPIGGTSDGDFGLPGAANAIPPGVDFLPGGIVPGTGGGVRRDDSGRIFTNLTLQGGKLVPWSSVFGLNPGYTFGGGIFGLNVPGFPVWVWPKDPGGNFTTAGQRGTAQAVADQTAAWYSEGQTQPAYPADVRPTTSRWLGDKRYNKTRVGKPSGWPDFPSGYQTWTCDSSEEEQQVELTLSVDPRIVCPSRPQTAAFGTIVSDVDAGLGMDSNAKARVHSFWRVVQGPAGTVGLLKNNARNDKDGTDGGRSDVLSWNLGPSGPWDTFGGMVTDYPDSGKGRDRDSRVHGMVSALLGGPFDVGGSEDVHDYGKDEEGRPIRPLHLSTEALIRRPFAGSKGYEDGPIMWERDWRQGGDLPEPLAVHLAWNPKAGRWGAWTTSNFYAPTGHGDPVTPPPGGGDPGRRGTPTVDPDDPDGPRGPIDPDPVGDPDSSGEPRPDDPDDPLTPFSSFASSGREPRWIAATRLETAFASIVARPERLQEGAQDVTGSWFYSPKGRKEHDATAPITGRLVAYGALGGEPGGSVMPGDKAFSYTQEPGRSMHGGGTAAGGFALLSPEALLSDADSSYAPDGITKSMSYLVATPSTCLAVGEPDLPTGGVKNGVSQCVNANGDMEFYSHDSVGDRLLVHTVGEGGSLLNVVTKGANYSMAPGDDVVLVTATASITLPIAAADTGRTVTVKSAAAGIVVTVDSAGGTIDGAATQLLSEFESVTCVSDGADWWII